MSGLQADPGPQSYIHKYHQKIAGLPGVTTHLQAWVRPPLLFKFLAQDRPAQSDQDIGTKDHLGTGSFCFLSAPQSWPWTTAFHNEIPPGKNWFPRSTDPQACCIDKPQSEATRPGNTRENHIAMGSTRTKAAETKATSHHQNPILPPHGALVTPTHQKSKTLI